MVPLSNSTLALVQQTVPEDLLQEVINLLENECADNLPFLEKATSEGLERCRYAVLKIGEGNIDKLINAIALAQQDWRDLLVAAEFAESVDAHKFWAIKEYGIG